MDKSPDLSLSSITGYFGSRLSTLRPPDFQEQKQLLNPFPALGQVTAKQWNFIAVAFLGWTWDAFDFFSVSLTATPIAETFHRPVSSVTWGITLVLMFRSVGATIFGLASDKWGRRWPFVINLVLFIILEMCTGFCNTLRQFLAVRALYGVAMGGLYGMCAAMALEDSPPEARGFLSGLLQQGYAFGYLLVAAFNRAFIDTPHGWRALFWFGAGPPVLIIIYRLMLPETDSYIAQRNMERDNLAGSFVKQGRDAIKVYWLMFAYMIVLMAGMNFMSHGSQDLYPTFLTAQLQFSTDASTVTNCVANLGALCGGIFFGHMSQFMGRRLTLMICCVMGGALVYPWVFIRQNAGINASVFFLQFAVQGAWGVIPIHLSELSPPRFRSFIVGVSYQLGNLASSASSTIESTIGERFPLSGPDGQLVPGKYNYGKVMAIFMGCVFGFVLIVSFLGPENHDANLLTRTTDDALAEAQNAYFEEKAAAQDHEEDV